MSGGAKALIAFLVAAAMLVGLFVLSERIPQGVADDPEEMEPVEQAPMKPEVPYDGPLVETAALHDTEYGGVIIDIPVADFEAAGFAFGDSVDISFSNGYEMKGIPYYNGYYVKVGEPLLLAYPGSDKPCACVNYGTPLWETSGLEIGDTATVKLHEKAKYKDIQDSLYMSYSDERVKFANDAVFANYREVHGGALKEDTLYRGASPAFDGRRRAGYVNALMQRDGIAYDLDLSDNPMEVEKHLERARMQGADTSYFETLKNGGDIGLIDLNQAYREQKFATSLAHGLYEMAKNDGPYYIHCIEGKDRTGFTCMLLEALAGATYDEMVADYMKTYDNYYGINQKTEPFKYETIKTIHADAMLAYIAGDTADDDEPNYSAGARNYLEYGGLSQAQISVIMGAICK